MSSVCAADQIRPDLQERSSSGRLMVERVVLDVAVPHRCGGVGRPGGSAAERVVLDVACPHRCGGVGGRGGGGSVVQRVVLDVAGPHRCGGVGGRGGGGSVVSGWSLTSPVHTGVAALAAVGAAVRWYSGWSLTSPVHTGVAGLAAVGAAVRWYSGWSLTSPTYGAVAGSSSLANTPTASAPTAATAATTAAQLIALAGGRSNLRRYGFGLGTSLGGSVDSHPSGGECHDDSLRVGAAVRSSGVTRRASDGSVAERRQWCCSSVAEALSRPIAGVRGAAQRSTRTVPWRHSSGSERRPWRSGHRSKSRARGDAFVTAALGRGAAPG